MENEILQQILDEIKGMNGRLDKLEAGQAETNGRLDKLEAGQARLEADVAEMKESLEEVRTTTNSLAEWADEASHETHTPFPVRKVQ